MLQPLIVNIWVSPSQPDHGWLWDNIHFPPVVSVIFHISSNFFFFNDVLLKLINSCLTCLRECLLDIFHISTWERALENVRNNKLLVGQSDTSATFLLVQKVTLDARRCRRRPSLKPLRSWEKSRTAFNAVLDLSFKGSGSSVRQLPVPNPPPTPLEDTDWPCNSEPEYNSYGSYSRRISRR